MHKVSGCQSLVSGLLNTLLTNKVTVQVSNLVRKHIGECTGREIMVELLAHLASPILSMRSSLGRSACRA